MSPRPGVRLATRPLHFFWVCDCSGSMSLDGKIDALNQGIRDALPVMVNVAEDNPNASVLIHSLKFSHGAEWITSTPNPLDGFHWTNLLADIPPKGSSAFSAEFKTRLQREGAQSGDVQISLIWNNYNDLDLHVTCPSGEKIYFGHRNSDCGGVLDVDMNVSPTSQEPVENVYWPPNGAPHGRYKVEVVHFKNHGRQGCGDPTNFKVAVSIGGSVQEFTGSVRTKETKLVHEFDLDSSTMAIASGGNTDLGAALIKVADKLKMPPMVDRAMPPVIVLLSDGQPTDDFEAGLQALMAEPWGKRAVRLAIAIGRDADLDVLQKFIGNNEIPPLKAQNAGDLTRFIQWASTIGIKTSSAPVAGTKIGNSLATPLPVPSLTSASEVW